MHFNHDSLSAWNTQPMGLKYKIQRRSCRVYYNDVMISATASQITNLAIVYSTIYPGADQRKHQSSASLAFVREIHRWAVNSLHKCPVTRKMFPFGDVIMSCLCRAWGPRICIVFAWSFVWCVIRHIQLLSTSFQVSTMTTTSIVIFCKSYRFLF